MGGKSEGLPIGLKELLVLLIGGHLYNGEEMSYRRSPFVFFN
jgi:hypothetical protein